MKTAIVSGANGFVGNAVVKELLSNGYRVYALVNKNTANIPKDPNLTTIHCSVDELDPVIKEIEGCDVFFHFAWSGSAGPERANVDLQLKNAQ